ncbi:MAG TPA: AraC family transcriptional regulator [Blastocatellia bacterium]|nr:AraC family transcriptional regulator [Blastocatellia bacterium]
MSNIPVVDGYLGPGQAYGRIVNKQLLSGLVLSELRHEGPKKLPAHSHELAFFCLLLDGSYAEQFGRRTVVYKPYTIMFHPPAMTHRDEIGHAGGRFFQVEVQTSWLDRLREYSPIPDPSPELNGGELVWLATRLYREHREPRSCSPLIIEGLVLEMLALTARASGVAERRPPAWLARATELLNEEFSQTVTVNRVAAEVGVHPVHLARVFRQFHHQTIGEYVHRLQVKFVCEQLSNPGQTLAEVALAAGFADQSHFTRVFKQVTGMTPGAFRSALASQTA